MRIKRQFRQCRVFINKKSGRYSWTRGGDIPNASHSAMRGTPCAMATQFEAAEQKAQVEATYRHSARTLRKDGVRSWLAVGSGVLIQAVVLGLLNSYGFFYVEFIKEFNCGKAESAWIGSLCYGLSMLLAPLGSLALWRFGTRLTVIVGCALCAVSAVTSSSSNSAGLLFLTFTLTYGAGASLACTPLWTAVPGYFERHAAIATGILVSGSSIGTLILSPSIGLLVESYGWRWTFRFLAGLIVISSSSALVFSPLADETCCALRQERAQAGRASVLSISMELWRNKTFVFWCLTVSLVEFGYYIPYVHMTAYALESGLTSTEASSLVTVLGAATAIGRIAFGKIVQSKASSHLYIHQAAIVLTGAALLLLPVIATFDGLVTFVVAIGLLDGCNVVLLPTLTETFVGTGKMVIAWDYLKCAAAATFTLGPPIAGWIREESGSYDNSFRVAAAPVLLGAAMLILVQLSQKALRVSEERQDLHLRELVDVAVGTDEKRADAVGEKDAFLVVPIISKEALDFENSVLISSAGRREFNLQRLLATVGGVAGLQTASAWCVPAVAQSRFDSIRLDDGVGTAAKRIHRWKSFDDLACCRSRADLIQRVPSTPALMPADAVAEPPLPACVGYAVADEERPPAIKSRSDFSLHSVGSRVRRYERMIAQLAGN